MNTDPSLCPVCNEPIPSEAPDGICPKCVLRNVVEGNISPPSVEPTTPEIQAVFTDYEILDLIGVGGIGRVYRARDPKVDRIVALKILSPDHGDDPEWIERFTREAKALARLNHPHIVQVHAFGTEPLPHLVMEFVDGVNLRQAMEEGGLSAREALVIVPKLCEALHYAHEHGVLHRDIKPENILVDTEGRVKLVDFGLAKLHDETALAFTLTQSGTKLGTVAYMAPEQIEKPSDVDHRADIYSLGVVFYEMLTGELPLGRFPSPSEANGTDPRLDSVVLRTLEKKREKRYPDAGTMGSEILNANEAEAPSPLPQAIPQTTRWKALAFLFAIVIVGLLAYATMRRPASADSTISPDSEEAAQLAKERKEKEFAQARNEEASELARGWIAEGSRIDDPEAKETAFREILQAIQDYDRVRTLAAIRALGYLAKVQTDRTVFREPLRKLVENEELDWEIRGHSITALFMTNYERSDIDNVLGMVESIPEKNLHYISSALRTVSSQDFTGEYAGPMLRLLERGLEYEKKRTPSVTSMENRYLLGVLWGARVSPEIEALVIEWSLLDANEHGQISTNSRAYYAFYSALSVFANKSTPTVERLLDLAGNPDMTNIAGRCFWGLKYSVPDKDDKRLVARSVIHILGQRTDEYMWRRGLEVLTLYSTAENIEALAALAALDGMRPEWKEELNSIIESLSQ